jgi:hypothetical protein
MHAPIPKIRIRKPVERTDPNSEMVSFLHSFGNQCKGDRAFVTAVVALKRALELSPDDPDLLCDLGASLWNYGDYATALDVLFRSIRIRPSATQE